MSWSCSVPAGPIGVDAKDFMTRAVDITTKLLADNPNLDTQEVRDQQGAAIEAAVSLIRVTFPSVQLGDEFHVQAYLSGHANKDHLPAAGWANDMVSVSVNQVTVAKGAARS